MLLLPGAGASGADLTVAEPGSAAKPGTVTFRGSYSGGGGAIEQHVSYAVDVSGSTSGHGGDCDSSGTVDAGDDFNADGSWGTILDCEIAGVAALNASLRRPTDPLPVSLIGFGSTAALADMHPAADKDTTEAASSADEDNDRIADLDQVASSLLDSTIRLFTERYVGGSTDFSGPLAQLLTLIENAKPKQAGNKVQFTLFFLSDGQANYPDDAVNALKAAAASNPAVAPPVVNTISVGGGAAGCDPASPLRKISDELGGSCLDVEPRKLVAGLTETKPQGLDKITVAFNGTTTEATVDALGNFTAKFDNIAKRGAPYPWTVTATLTDGAAPIVKQGSVSIYDDKLTYAALGDSFSAGWGLLPSFKPGDKDDPNVNDKDDPTTGKKPAANPVKCGRSRAATGMLVHKPLASAPIVKDGNAVVRFRACGGAVSRDVVGKPQHSGEAGPQLAFLDDDTDLVTYTVGGNDVNFADIIQRCGLNSVTDDCQDQGYLRLNSGRQLTLSEFATLRLALVQPDLLDVARRVRAKAANATVVMADYPHLLSTNAQVSCIEGKAYRHGERQWLADRVDDLNGYLETIAAEAGIYFADVAKRFENHEKCDDVKDEWTYGVEASLKQTDPQDMCKTVKLPHNLGHQTGCVHIRSFHPTPAGAKAYADAYSDLLYAKSRPPFRISRAGLPVNPAPTLPPAVASARAAKTTAARAIARAGLNEQEVAEVKGFETGDAAPSDLGAIQGVAAPAACGDRFDALPGALLTVTGDGFAPGATVHAKVEGLSESGGAVELPAVTADELGVAAFSFILPRALGGNPVIATTLTGPNPSGFQRRLTSTLDNGAADTACIAASDAAGLLSPDGRTLPSAAAPVWAEAGVSSLAPAVAPTPAEVTPAVAQQPLAATGGATPAPSPLRVDRALVSKGRFAATVTGRATAPIAIGSKVRLEAKRGGVWGVAGSAKVRKDRTFRIPRTGKGAPTELRVRADQSTAVVSVGPSALFACKHQVSTRVLRCQTTLSAGAKVTLGGGAGATASPQLGRIKWSLGAKAPKWPIKLTLTEPGQSALTGTIGKAFVRRG